MRGLRRKRYQRHRDRGRKRRARHARHDLGVHAVAFHQPQQRRQTGKVGKRIAQHAQAEVAAVLQRGGASDEALDLLDAASDEQCRVVDQAAHDLDPAFVQVAGQVGRREHGGGAADRPQRFEASDGEQAGIARPESGNANQHAPE
jgi:hypothetical protein